MYHIYLYRLWHIICIYIYIYDALFQPKFNLNKLPNMIQYVLDSFCLVGGGETCTHTHTHIYIYIYPQIHSIVYYEFGFYQPMPYTVSN